MTAGNRCSAVSVGRTMRRSSIAPLALSALTLLAACGPAPEAVPDDAVVPPIGSLEGPCGPTVLTNARDDAERLAADTVCFLEAHEAGEPIVWDVVLATVEGDPILRRYDSDGSRVVITEDSTRDSFGSGRVTVLDCAAVADTGFLVEGLDCVETAGEPLELADGVWPFDR